MRWHTYTQLFAAWIRLAVSRSFLGFVRRQVRPTGVACLGTARAHCWLNGKVHRYTPVLQVLLVEPWCAPLPEAQALCLHLGLGLGRGALLGRWWEGPGLLLFVDGTHDGQHWRMGGFISTGMGKV